MPRASIWKNPSALVLVPVAVKVKPVTATLSLKASGGHGGPDGAVLGVVEALVVHHRRHLVEVGDVQGDVGGVGVAGGVHRGDVEHEAVGAGLEVIGRAGGAGGGEGDVAQGVDLEEPVGAGVGAGGGESEAGDRDVVAEGEGGHGGPDGAVLGVVEALVVHHRRHLVEVGDVQGDVGGVGVAGGVHRGDVEHEAVGAGLEVIGRAGGAGGGEGDVAQGVDLEEPVGAGRRCRWR